MKPGISARRRRTYAGCTVGRQRSGGNGDESSSNVPRNEESVENSTPSARRADAPKVITTTGLSAASWRTRNPRHFTISASVGGRFAGGRHFTALHTYTSSRVSPTEVRALSSRRPEAPQKGRPDASSLAPGASPINTIDADGGPEANTEQVREACKGHATHADASAAIEAKRSTDRYSARQPKLAKQANLRPR